MLKAYYDGGNKADSETYKVLTLAGYAATDSIWERIERRWDEVLAEHGAEFMHMTDAFSLAGSFSKDKGWNESMVGSLVDDLIQVMKSFHGCPIQGVSCTVVLRDYLNARKNFPELPSVESLCVNQCIGASLLWYSMVPGSTTLNGAHLQQNSVDIFFDRGERFFGHASDAWNHKKLRTRTTFKAIRSMAQAEMRRTPALQMADMLAWSHNRPFGNAGHEDVCSKVQEAISDLHRRLESPEISDIDPDKLETFKQLNFPRRKPMR